MFSTIFERSGVTGTGNLTDYSDFWFGFGGTPASAGKAVSKDTAMSVWAVYACISLISETFAQLPCKLKRPRKGGGKEDAIGPLHSILKDSPNPEMTSFEFREMQQANILGTGNCYSWIERSRMGIIGLWPIPSEWVEPRRANARELASLGLTKRNSIVYDVMENGRIRVVPAEDILHVRGFSFGGLKGDSVITKYAKETIGTAIALDEFEGKHIKNGVHVSGVLEHPEALGENAEAFKTALVNRYQGGANAGVPMVLENGMKYNQFKISLSDQQFIEQKQLKVSDICGIFKVPKSKISISDSSTNNNNTEQNNRGFVDTTMHQWVVRWEQAQNMKLLSDSQKRKGYFVKYNFDAMLRPDPKARAEINQIEWRQGVPINVLLERDDRNPVEGGDVGFVQSSYIPVSEAVKAKEPEPTAARSIEKDMSRVLRLFFPLVRSAAQKVINFEGIAVKRQLKKCKRDSLPVQLLIDEFYEKQVPVRIERELAPVLTSFAEAIYFEVSRGEGDAGPDFREWMDDYILTCSRRHIETSSTQLRNLLAESGAASLIVRVDEWEEVRAKDIAKLETDEIMYVIRANYAK